jgi:putative membrane protein
MTPAKKPPPKVQRETWSIMDVLSLLAFLIWCGAGLYFTTHHVTPAVIKSWKLSPDLTDFVNWCRTNGDPVLIVLAFINTHLHASRQWANDAARRWAATVIVLSYGIEWLGTWSGVPFGDYHYTDKFGPVIWTVPLTIPLAWHVVLTNALFVMRAVSPHTSRMTEALLAGGICTVYDVILEPFATTVKGYWVWADKSVPPINYVAWFVISSLLIYLFAPTLSTRYRFDPRPWLILGLTVAIFIAGEMK